MPRVDEKVFQQLLKVRLGEKYERGLKAFREYGENLSFDVANVLIHAADQGKADEVLDILEEHFRTHLQFQHPEIRGQVSDALLGVNPTCNMFLRICQTTLGLKPDPP